MSEVERAQRNFIAEHQQRYIESGGTEGHILDMTSVGGHGFTTTLLLRTVGRKSGETRVNALIYGDISGEVVIVASKGGADAHPGWYHNIKGAPTIGIQIATQAFLGEWRELEGAEREAIWTFMEKVYPPYTDYQARTDRLIPIIAIRPTTPTDIFTA